MTAASIDLSPDGERFVVGMNACRAEVWDVAGPTRLFSITGYQREVVVAAVSPDGRAVLTAGKNGQVRVSALADGVSLSPFPLPFSGTPEPLGVKDRYFSADGVRCLAVSADGRLLFAGGWDHGGVLLGATDGARRGDLTGHEKPITSAAFTADGKRLLTGGADKTVRLWDAAAGGLLRTWTFPAPIRYVCLAPDGSRAVVQAQNKGRLLDLVGPGGAPTDDFWSISRGGAILPDGKGVLVGLPNGADLWDADKRVFTGLSLPHTSSVSAVAVDAEGRRAATGAWNVGHVWDLRTGAPVGPPLLHSGGSGHEERFRAMAFSPDSCFVAGLAFDGAIRLWDAATGRPVGPVMQQSGAGALAFHPDGSVLFTSGRTASVCRWRVPRPAEGKAELLTLQTQVLTGMELDAEGVVHLLSADAWRERRQRLEELAPGTIRYLEP